MVSHRGETSQESEDGGIYIGDTRYETLSSAGKAVTGSQSEAGWWFWLVDPGSDRSMSDIRQSYLEALNAGDAFEEDQQET